MLIWRLSIFLLLSPLLEDVTPPLSIATNLSNYEIHEFTHWKQNSHPDPMMPPPPHSSVIIRISWLCELWFMIVRLEHRVRNDLLSFSRISLASTNEPEANAQLRMQPMPCRRLRSEKQALTIVVRWGNRWGRRAKQKCLCHFRKSLNRLAIVVWRSAENCYRQCFPLKRLASRIIKWA